MSRKNRIKCIIVKKEFFMKPLKEKISITIDADLLKDLKEEADKDERSLSQFINLILRKYINEIKEN